MVSGIIPSKKALEMMLSTLAGFEKPKAKLEQYVTPSDLAAELLWQAYSDGNVRDKVIVDLGCGTGILAIGAALLGAKKVFGFDIDEDAIKIANKNLELLKGTKIPLGEVVFEAGDVTKVEQLCDVVMMNPPFGIQKGNKHADKKFLEKAFQISDIVYSFHKVERTNFPEKVAKANDFKAFFVKEVEFPIKATMEFHKKPRREIKVGIWKLWK